MKLPEFCDKPYAASSACTVCECPALFVTRGAQQAGAHKPARRVRVSLQPYLIRALCKRVRAGARHARLRLLRLWRAAAAAAASGGERSEGLAAAAAAAAAATLRERRQRLRRLLLRRRLATTGVGAERLLLRRLAGGSRSWSRATVGGGEREKWVSE